MSVAAGNKNNLTRLIAVVLTGILAGLAGMVLALILRDTAPGFWLQCRADRRFGVIFTGRHGVILATPHRGNRSRRWRRRIWLAAAWSLWAEAGFHCGGGGQPFRTHASRHHDDPRPAADRHRSAGFPPLGREVAPREMGALGAGMVARKLGLLEDETRTLIACGAGAGLAAVYNVPLAGALFSLEVMLLSFSWEKTLAAIMTSAIAAWTATLGLGDESQYHFVSSTLPHSLSLVGDSGGPDSWHRRLALS